MINVAIDTSPLLSDSNFRGVGMYVKKLVEFLQKEKEIRLLDFKGRQIPKEADLVHYPYFSPFIISLPLFLKKKFVVTVHDLIPLVFPEAYPPGVKGKLKYLIQKELLKKSSMIITDSQSSADDVVKFIFYPKEKIQVIYLAAANLVQGEKEEKLLELVRLKFKLPSVFVLFVGDVNFNKNLPGLVKACRLAEVPLVIVGKQAVSRNFNANHIENRSLVELNELIGEKNDVIRTGFVNEEELAVLYSLASVYCQPSFYEGFGFPLLEAMACGCPILSSNTSSLPEIGGEAVIYVNPDNIEGMAGGIRRLISDKTLRAKMISAGFEQAKKFSWEKTARETKNIYEKVLAE